MSLALARKYRPRNFATVAVQTHVSRTLRGAIAHGRVANGYLLCGPRGTGKTTLARVLAMALNCEQRAQTGPDEGEPCGVCTSCQRIWEGSTSLDVVEIDAASNRGVDDARDLRERAMYAPSSEGRYKVYIVDEAHMLTRDAWNALLKILEEPPPRVVFVFATTEPQKIAQLAAPVLSRLQRFDLKRIGAQEIRSRLAEVLQKENAEADAEAIGMIARAADGSMRDALSLTDQVLAGTNGAITIEGVRDSLGLVAEQEYLALLDIIVARNAAAVFPAVARLAEEGVDFTLLLTGMADLLRSLLAQLLGGEAGDLSDTTRKALAERSGDLVAGDVMRMLNLIAEVEPRFARSSQQQLLLETTLVKFALLDRTVSIEDLLQQRNGSGDGGAGRSAAERAAPPSSGTSAVYGQSRKGSAADAAPLPAAAQPAASAERAMSSAAESRAEREEARRVSSEPADMAPSKPNSDPATENRLSPLDLNHLAEVWDDAIAKLRDHGRAVLASHLAAAIPSAVSSRGVITVQLDDNTVAAYDLVQEALTGAQNELLGVLRKYFSGVEKVVLSPPRAADGGQPAVRRLTAEALKEERLASLRRKDPVLDAAVRELDLELLD